MHLIWGLLCQHGTFAREVKGKRGIKEERNTLYLSDLHLRNLPHSRRRNKPYPHGKKLSINLWKVVWTHNFMHEILPSPMSSWCCMTYMNLMLSAVHLCTCSCLCTHSPSRFALVVYSSILPFGSIFWQLLTTPFWVPLCLCWTISLAAFPSYLSSILLFSAHLNFVPIAWELRWAYIPYFTHCNPLTKLSQSLLCLCLGEYNSSVPVAWELRVYCVFA